MCKAKPSANKKAFGLRYSIFSNYKVGSLLQLGQKRENMYLFSRTIYFKTSNGKTNSAVPYIWLYKKCIQNIFKMYKKTEQVTI